jgi:predicted nucleic acid-binding protein
MILVVDASAIAAIIFGEREGPQMVNYLEDQTLVAPVLIDFELANIAVKKIRRVPQRMPEVIAALERADGLKIDRVAVPRIDVVSLAAETGLTVYDAAYLWVAMSMDTELVTLDTRLARINDQLRERARDR